MDLRRCESMKVKFAYTGIRVKDLEASVKFYTNVLGVKEVERFSQPSTKGTVVILVMEEGGHQLELNDYPKGSRFDTRYEVGEGLDHLAFETTDLDGVLAEAQKAGYPAVLEMRDPAHCWAYIQDPNGSLPVGASGQRFIGKIYGNPTLLGVVET